MNTIEISGMECIWLLVGMLLLATLIKATATTRI